MNSNASQKEKVPTKADLIHEVLPRVRIEELLDVSFRNEPRLLDLQNGYFDMRRMLAVWQFPGDSGQARAEREKNIAILNALQNVARNGKDIEAATTTKPLHERQDAQIKYALTIAHDLGQIVAAMGEMQAPREFDASLTQWCDLGGKNLGTRMVIEGTTAWIIKPFNARVDSHNPINRVGMVSAGNGAELVASTFWSMQIPLPAHNRIIEAAELGRWALRQAKAKPAVTEKQ